MILNSLDKQLALSENGQITWQKDLTNPVAGGVVAEVKKGASILSPVCSLVTDAPALDGEDQEKVTQFINDWLGRYVAEALLPLFNLKSDDIPEGAPRDVSLKIHDALGVIPRSDLQSLISQMDEDQRNSLRSKKIRFGPLLVYLPELNKPAAVRLRALLLTLWNDKELPAEVPADGIVSFSVEGKELDKNYYQSIGYPIYGPRSIRVDMLDRVICAVYDGAKDGQFMAQHQMAEWLGSNIADLYAVLEAMGHKKIKDPADDVVEEVKEESATPVVESAVEKKPEVVAVETDVASKEKVEFKKPDLATFALKKGKAIDNRTPSAQAYKKNNKFSGSDFKSDKKKFNSNHKKKQPVKQKVFIAEAETKPEDSPFAILEQLKTGQKD